MFSKLGEAHRARKYNEDTKLNFELQQLIETDHCVMPNVAVLSLGSNFQVLFTLENFERSSLFGQDEYKTTIFILKTINQTNKRF